jgi:hypothetical protein
MAKLQLHGRDHRPGGADPISGIGGCSWAHSGAGPGFNGSHRSVAGTSNLTITWDQFQTNDTSIFSTTTNTVLDSGIKIAQLGLLLMRVEVQWETGVTNVLSRVGWTANSSAYGVGPYDPNNATGVTYDRNANEIMSIRRWNDTSQTLTVIAYNNNAGAKFVEGVEMMVVWLPQSSTSSTTVFSS